VSKQVGKAARNEIRKLQATYVNSMAIGMLLAGIIAPYAAYTLSSEKVPFLEAATTPMGGLIALWTIGCTAISYGAHTVAKSFLEEIED
jgi:hypothetical protein